MTGRPDSSDQAGSTTTVLSRRALLRGFAAAGVGVGVIATATACNDGGAGDTLTLDVTPDGPYEVMPSAEERRGDVTTQAYATALQEWLDDNPGVRLRTINVDLWSQEAMVTALAGGTGPAIFQGNVLGDYSQPAIQSAFMQGLAADVTDLLEESGLTGRLADYVRPVWEEVWPVDGRFYGAPSGYGVGDGIFYRRDLFAAAGLDEPVPEWTWQDVRRMAAGLTEGDRRGIGMPQWNLGVMLASEGHGLLTEVPAPEQSWHWRWNYTWALDTWVRAVENYRAMMFTDESVVSDVSFNSWNEVRNAFLRSQIGMQPGNVDQFTESPDSETSFVRLAERLGKPIGDVVGWMTYPLGALGQFPDRRTYVGAMSFSPDLDEEALAKAFDLHAYMLGPGMVRQKIYIHDETGDLQRVYTGGTLMPLLAETAEQLPGDPVEAWGEQYVAEVRRAGSRVPVPVVTSFLPPEEASGPSGEPWEDATSRWMYERGDLDLPAELRQLGETRNSQAEGFTSSIAGDEFASSIADYYQAQDEFLREDAPRFHAEVFQAWHDEVIRPAIG